MTSVPTIRLSGAKSDFIDLLVKRFINEKMGRLALVGGAVRDELLSIEVLEKDWVVVGSTEKDLTEEGYYWNGYIPQTVLIDGEGNIKYDKNGLIDIDEINKIIAEIKGIDIEDTSFSVESFNEYNSIISKKDKSNMN